MNNKYLGCLKKLIEINLNLNKFEESIKYCMLHLNLNDKSAEVHTYLALNLINKVILKRKLTSYFNSFFKYQQFF